MTFFFDPGCPWTWITSRWFVAATERRGIATRWRAFSLACINDGADVGPDKAERLQITQRALRVVESLTAEQRHADAHAFYTELGTRLHEQSLEPSDELSRAAGEAAGIDDVAERLSRESLDDTIRSAYDEIHSVLGDEVGSPAIRLDATGNALFGPIVSPAPSEVDGDRLLAATITLLEIPQFYELKRSRTGPPEIAP